MVRLRLRKEEHRQRFLERRSVNLRDYDFEEELKTIKKDIKELKKASLKPPADKSGIDSGI